MDKLTPKQLKMLRMGGNKRLYDVFEKYDLLYESIQRRYHTKAAQHYREVLEKETK